MDERSDTIKFFQNFADVSKINGPVFKFLFEIVIRNYLKFPNS